MKQIKNLFIVIALSFLIAGCSQANTTKLANPDVKGKWVFHSLRTGVDREGWGNYILKDGKIKLVSHKGGFLNWSPDGKSFACYGKKVIWIYDDEGNLKKTINTKYQPNDLAWHPDGESIIYSADDKVGNKKYNYYLVRMTLSDSIDQVLKAYNNKKITFHISSIRISPDGKRVIFNMGTTGEDDGYIYVMDMNSGIMQQLRKDASVIDWFPDNKHIAFVTNRDEQGKIINSEWGRMYKINGDTGELSILEETSRYFYKGDRLSKDGKWLYYEKPTPDGGSQIMMCPVRDRIEREKEIPVTYSFYVNDKIKYSRDTQPDWHQGN